MTPTFDLQLKNQSLFARIEPFLVSLSITDEPGLKRDKLDLVLVNQGLELPQTGELVKVSLGYKETGVYDMGTFSIDGYTLSAKEIHITAHAADFLENFKNPQTRTFTQTTLASIVRTVAQNHGIEALVSEALSSIKITTLHQTAESDLHFLTRLGQQYHLLIKPAGHTLVALPLNAKVSASGQALPEVVLTPDSVLNWNLRLSKREEIPSVTAKGYDVDTAEEFHETVGDGDYSEEPVGYALRGLYPTRDAAKTAAQSVYEKLIQKTYTFSAEIIGNPFIMAESHLFLQGFQHEIPTRWKVSRTTHSLSSSGYKTSLEAMLEQEYTKQFAEERK